MYGENKMAQQKLVTDEFKSEQAWVEASLSSSLEKLALENPEEFLRRPENMGNYFMPMEMAAESKTECSGIFIPDETDLTLDPQGNLELIFGQLGSVNYHTLVMLARTIFVPMGTILEKLDAFQCTLAKLELPLFALHREELLICQGQSLHYLPHESQVERNARNSNEAWHFGLLLYQFVSGNRDPEQNAVDPFAIPKLRQTEEGQTIQTVINGLTQADPTQRWSVARAASCLEAISHELVQKKALLHFRLNKIQNLAGDRFGADTLIEKCVTLINTATPKNMEWVRIRFIALEKREQQRLDLKLACRCLLDKVLTLNHRSGFTYYTSETGNEPNQNQEFLASLNLDKDVINKATFNTLEKISAKLQAKYKELLSAPGMDFWPSLEPATDNEKRKTRVATTGLSIPPEVRERETFFRARRKNPGVKPVASEESKPESRIRWHFHQIPQGAIVQGNNKNPKLEPVLPPAGDQGVTPQ